MESSNPNEASLLLDKFLPEYQLRQIDRIRVKAPPDKAWPIVRNLDTYELPISKLLFTLRTLPDVLLKRSKGQRLEIPQHSRIDDFTGPTKGFKILAEEQGKEIVIGSVGKFWKIDIPFVHVNKEEFQKFNSPGYGKLAWNLRLDPDSHGGSWLSWELRVTATDPNAWKTFKKYWFLIGKFSHLLRKMALKQFIKKLGQVDEEQLHLAGDSVIPKPRFQKTMSTTVEGKPTDLWPWLVQMGCQRAGWYSIDRLDNGGIESSHTILPQFQNIKVGDVLPSTPKGKTGFIVVAIDKPRSLVLQASPFDEKGKEVPVSDSWEFALEPIGPNATRLITRVRAEFHKDLKMKLFTRAIGAAHFIMESSQLKNLKRRVEGT